MKYVVIKDMSAGNEFVGEMWKETKIFEGTDQLDIVMEWALSKYIVNGPSHRNVVITVADNE
jgi:hypothetical protein